MKNDLTTAEWLLLDDFLVTGVLPAGIETRQDFKKAIEKFSKVAKQIRAGNRK